MLIKLSFLNYNPNLDYKLIKSKLKNPDTVYLNLFLVLTLIKIKFQLY